MSSTPSTNKSLQEVLETLRNAHGDYISVCSVSQETADILIAMAENDIDQIGGGLWRK